MQDRGIGEPTDIPLAGPQLVLSASGTDRKTAGTGGSQESQVTPQMGRVAADEGGATTESGVGPAGDCEKPHSAFSVQGVRWEIVVISVGRRPKPQGDPQAPQGGSS